MVRKWGGRGEVGVKRSYAVWSQKQSTRSRSTKADGNVPMAARGTVAEAYPGVKPGRRGAKVEKDTRKDLQHEGAVRGLGTDHVVGSKGIG